MLFDLKGINCLYKVKEAILLLVFQLIFHTFVAFR
jgi:hypothetical protein